MTYHQKKNWKSYCSEPLELVENYQQAKADDLISIIHHFSMKFYGKIKNKLKKIEDDIKSDEFCK